LPHRQSTLKPLSACHLYTFIDTAYTGERQLSDVAQQLCDGGSDLIQLRSKTSGRDQIRKMADAVLPVTRAATVGLVINDHLIIAREVGAEYCHLGQEDFFERGHRHISELLPGDIGIGLSSHAPAQAERAMAAGAAYIAIGPVYATPTKPAANPVTLDYVRWAAANVQVPWFAIGGINLENVDEVLGAGARRICVVSAILNSPDIARTCQKFKQRLGSSG